MRFNRRVASALQRIPPVITMVECLGGRRASACDGSVRYERRQTVLAETFGMVAAAGQCSNNLRVPNAPSLIRVGPQRRFAFGKGGGFSQHDAKATRSTRTATGLDRIWAFRCRALRWTMPKIATFASR
jgi:hypothetical protein